MAAYRFVILAACLAVSDALVVGGAAAVTVRRAAPCRPQPQPQPSMKSQEDREFEEWKRNKMIASGVDPDEDFAGGRAVESSIYTVGGARQRIASLIA